MTSVRVAAVVALFVSAAAWSQEDSDQIRRLRLDDGEIEYRSLGSGPAILFIHGGLFAGASEEFLAQPALADFRIVVYHRRGYAGSAAEPGPSDDYIKRHALDAAAVLEHLDIERAHVFGHSSGGTIAIQLAFDRPDLVASLVLLEPAIQSLLDDPSAQPPEPPAPLIEALQSGNVAGALDVFMAVMAGRPQWRSQTSRSAVEQAEKDALTFFTFEAPAIATWRPPPMPDAAREIPVLYVSGSRSPVPASYADIVEAWFPETQRLVIEGVSHGLHDEDPRAAAEGTASFVLR